MSEKLSKKSELDAEIARALAAEAAPTNAAVVTAIEEDPAAARVAMGLDDGNGNIPVQGVALADTGAVALDPGDSERVLGLNSNNQLVLHTGDDNGDDLPHLVSSNQFIQLGQAILGPDMENETAFSVPVARIRLSATDAVVGKRISLSGTASFNYIDAARPDESFQLVIHPEETILDDTTLIGVRIPLGTAVTKEVFLFTVELALVAGTTGKFTILSIGDQGGFHHKDSSGTATSAVFATTPGTAIGTIGVDQDILISVYASDYGGDVTSLSVGGALSVNIYTP